jgi:hypothetical protein
VPLMRKSLRDEEGERALGGNQEVRKPLLVDEEAAHQPTGRGYMARAWWRVGRRGGWACHTGGSRGLNPAAGSGLEEEATAGRRRPLPGCASPRRASSSGINPARHAPSAGVRIRDEKVRKNGVAAPRASIGLLPAAAREAVGASSRKISREDGAAYGKRKG